MTSDQRELAKRAFQEALSYPSPEQQAILSRVCGDDIEARTEAARLLEWNQQAGDFLQSTALESLGVTEALEPEHGVLLQGRYAIERLLGDGGFSSVYLATDTRLLDRKVVVKVLRPRPGLELQFEHELAALAALEHPNIVPLYDSGVLEDSRPYLVTRFIDGPTLRQVIQAGPVSATRFRELMRQIVEGLEAAHRTGIAHLDLKPENVLISAADTRSGEHAYLIDFGIARIRDRHFPSPAGSADYMAPEQKEGKGVVASDFYALAVMGFEMLTGSLPGPNPAAQLARIGGLSAGLRSAMASLLTSDPHTRAEQFFVFRHELSAKPRGKGLAAAAVLIGLLTAAVWSRTGSQPASLKVSPATPFTTDPGEERFPDFSPDGEWVYYSARPNRSRETDIFVRPRSGDRARPITQTPEKEERPKASPDGSRIAFLRFPERGDIQVIVKDLSSGAETLAVAGNLHSFAWHPDAKRLIVSGTPSGTKVAGLYWVGLSPRSQSIFRSFDQTRDIDPEFSPDGKQLAVVREFGPYTEDLVVMDLDEKSNLLGTRRLTTRSVHARSLAYLPSGRQLVFLAGHAGLMTLWSAAVDGRTPPIQWKDDGQRLDYLAVSRARNVLVYGIDQEDANVWRASLGPDGELREAGPVISSTWSDDAPAVSPDGQHLVFLSTRSGNEQVWLARVDGSEARQLTRINGSINELSWAPDSRTILLSHTERGLSKSWTLDIRTGASREIYRETARGGARAFSRDGRSLYFASTRSGSYELYRMALETKAVERLTWKGGFVLAEDWDGKGIYFTPQRSAEGLWYMPFGSEPRQVAPELERRAFAASRSGVYFVAQRALWFWHKATGKVRKLWNPGKAFGFGLSLSPDERNLYFTIYDREGVDLTMVEDIER